MSKGSAIYAERPGTAVILAGGLGTRLQAVVADKPKALAQIAGKPFLAYLLEQLARGAIEQTVICTGYRADEIRKHFGDQFGSMRLHYSRETSPLGTGGALRLALPMLQTKTAVVYNGDSLAEFDLNAFWSRHHELSARASLLLARMENTTRFGTVEIDVSGRIVRFAEKCHRDGSGWISAGVYLLDVDLVREIPADRGVSLEREIFPHWIGKRFFGFTNCTRFIDIGTPDSYAAAEQFIRAGNGFA